MMQKNSVFKTILFCETGTHHVQNKKLCEDSVRRSFDKQSGVTSIALSDGAGSYCQAKVGAEITSRVAADVAARKFELLYSLDEATAALFLLREVNAEIRSRAEIDKASVEDYSATLLLAAIHPDGRYLLFHVGDGIMIGFTDKCKSVLLSAYEHTGFANETTFVTVPETEYHFLRGQGGYYGFLLMSDGPEWYLVREKNISPKVKLIQQLSFVWPESAVQMHLNELTKMLADKGMYDDASFALITNLRAYASVYHDMDSVLKDILFKSKDQKRKQLRRHENILFMLAEQPNGISEECMMRKLRLRSVTVTKKKLQQLLNQNLVERKNGRYFISR